MNLTIDCLLWVALVAAMGFPLWIAATVYLATTLNFVIVHGLAGLARSHSVYVVGALLGWGVAQAGGAGWSLALETSGPTTAVCLIGGAGYMVAIGLASHRRNQRLREIRQALSQRTEELARTLAQLQRTQADLVEAEKLASLGSLVAGVAHELNTPIGNALVTASALDQASRHLAQEIGAGALKRSVLQEFLGRTSEMAELIVRSCQRAARLIVSFKQVAVDQAGEQMRAFDLRQVVDDHLAALASSMHCPSVRLVMQVPPAIECLGYPGALGQVLTGLVHNAHTHGFAAGAQGTVRVQAHAEQGQVTLRVSDDGRGMSPDVLKHVFDPFFTTRLGQGQSGLGLTICHNIATGLLGGSLHAESELGRGAVFVLSFPQQAPQPVMGPAGA